LFYQGGIRLRHFRDLPLPLQERTPFYKEHAVTKKRELNSLAHVYFELNTFRSVGDKFTIQNKNIIVSFKTEMTTKSSTDVVTVE